MMNDSDNAAIDNVCRELSTALQGTLTWKWDRRFETVLAEFGVARKDEIRAILEQNLGAVWESANVGNAPDIVGAIDDRFGGLRPGQIIFTSDPKLDALIFCTWWPWGNGQDISIRVGPSYKNISESERAENLQKFKLWFGV